MGGNVCRCLLEKGNSFTVFDKKPDALRQFEGQAVIAGSAGEVFAASDVIFLSLPNSKEVEAVMEELFAGEPSGKTVIDLSTSYPLSTQTLSRRLAEAGGVLLDAPLMAGPEEARAGTLQTMVGGDKEAMEKLMPLFRQFCTQIDHVGPSGNAHIIKIMMNFTGLMYALLLGQMFPLAEKLGINPEMLYKLMNNEILGNWVYRFYSPKMIDRSYGMAFKLELGLKDLDYMKQLYEQFGTSAYALNGGIELLRKACEQGKGALDFSQLASVVYSDLEL